MLRWLNCQNVQCMPSFGDSPMAINIYDQHNLWIPKWCCKTFYFSILLCMRVYGILVILYLLVAKSIYGCQSSFWSLWHFQCLLYSSQLGIRANLNPRDRKSKYLASDSSSPSFIFPHKSFGDKKSLKKRDQKATNYRKKKTETPKEPVLPYASCWSYPSKESWSF